MKWLLILCGSFFLLYGCTDKQHLSDINNKKIYLENKEEQWHVLTIWAEWCNLCLKEIIELNHLSGKKNIKVLGYNFDNLDDNKLLNLKQRLAIDFPLINRPPFAIIKKNIPRVIPTIYIISPKGEVVEEITGFNSHKVILDKISAHTQVKLINSR